jgi:hypothetical protein
LAPLAFAFLRPSLPAWFHEWSSTKPGKRTATEGRAVREAGAALVSAAATVAVKARVSAATLNEGLLMLFLLSDEGSLAGRRRW